MEQARLQSGSSPRQELERVRFGEFLREEHLINDEQLLAALGDHWSNGGSIGAAIVRGGFLSQDEIDEHATRYHGLDTIEV